MRRSLADSTAALLQQAQHRDPTPTGGSQRSSDYAPVIRRWDTTGHGSEPSGGMPTVHSLDETSTLPRVQMDELVERVVATIEQRVIDELERRGRRNLPGVF